MFLLNVRIKFDFLRWGLHCVSPPVIPHQEKEHPPNLTIPNGYVLDNPGNPNYGEIYLLRQLHYSSISCSNRERILLIGRYQFAILKELIRLDIRDVFEEGLTINVPPGIKKRTRSNLIDHAFEKGVSKETLSAFSSGIKTKPTDNQLLVLGKYGACTVFALLNDNVFLHKTIDAETLHGISLVSLMIPNFGDGLSEQILEKIDKEAKKEFVKFFKENRGAKTAFILGMVHNFDLSCCNKNFNPVIFSRSFFNEDMPDFLHSGPYEGTYNLFPIRQQIK